jgi:enoyl-CoA hydratase/carnithine racemase
MATMELMKEGTVYILTLINGADANTITEDVVCEYNDVLDELEASEENAASDLDWHLGSSRMGGSFL